MATRGAMWAGGRVLAGRGATAAVTNAATRQFATSMTGRVIGGIAGGAANFGTFEGIKEMETQFAHGGHIVGQDDTGRYLNEGYSASAVAGQAAHGFLMGGAIGWLTPVSGNVADKLVRSTSSTGLKVMERAGVYSGATMLEGTIFSVPEWIEGNRDAMDVWTDNMAMMVGFKAKHMIKSAGNVLGDLKASFDSPTNGRKNRLDFESRLRQRMDAPSDGGLSLTKDEAAELSKHGYGDLRELVESAERTGDATKGELITANAPEIVSRLTDMVTDPRISEAARAKMYYYATGRKLPVSTVMKGELIEDGEGGFIVESQGANGVITSRSFKSRKAADLELERIKRQTELNHIEIGERYQQTADFENRLQEACRTVAAENGWDMVEVYRTCEEARRNNLRGGDKQFDEAQQNILRKVTEAMGEFEETSVTDNMRGRINDKYGVDIDNAIRKEANRRTIAEQTAIDEYLDELIPKNAKERNTVEDAEAEDITNQKLLTDEPEATTPTNDAPIDPRFDNPTTPEYDPHQPGGEQKPVGRAVMKYQDRPVEVLSGRVVMMEDGTMIDNERSDASIVVRDLETGKVEMVSPDAILSYEGYPAEVEVPQDNVAPEAETPAEPQPKYTTGQIKIRNSDGTETRGVLTGFVDENGNHEYYVEGDLQHLHYASEHELDNILSEYTPDEPQEVKQPQPAEPQPVDPNRPTQEGVANVEDYDKGYSFGIDETQGISDSELTAKISELRTDAERLTDFGRGMLEAYEYEQQRRAMEQQLVPVDAETVPKTEETTLNPMETGVNITETVPKTEIPIENVQQSVDDGNVVVPAPATNEAPQVDNVSQPDLTAQAEPTPLQRIPRNEKNEPIFEQAESPEVGWDALVEFSEGDAATAKEIADTMVEEKRKAFEKAQKLKPKGKTPTEILASKKANTAELTKAQAEYEQWQRMAGVENARQSAIRSQQEVEARRLAAERAEAEKAEREAREEAARLEREALEGIPEWHMDTPENARKRGVRRFSGQMFTRQEPVQGVVGNEVEVKFSQKDLPKGRVAVIEASQLQPSHVQGQRNPMFFIEEAQPKNRAEAVSMFAAKEMAEGIRPKEITGSVTAYTGAPTVNTRGEVIQGNNRSDALRYLWQSNLPQQQQTYKQYLIDNAEQFGIDPEAVNAMQNPVLVNMLDVDDAEAIRLGQMTAQDTESGGIERIKPKNVAQTLGDNMRTFANMLLSSGEEDVSFGQLVDRNGTEVMKWMNQVGAISNTQFQSAFDSKSNLTAEAKNDLQKVLYQAVFKGASQQLEEMFDKLPAKAQRAILATAFRDMDSPFAGKMLPEIQASIIVYNQLMSDPTFANAKKMEEVLKAVEAFKQTIALDDRFERYMPADNFSNFALHLAAMYKATDMSQATIASCFNQMYDLAQGKKAATLFDEADTTEYPLAEVINQVFNFEYQPAKNGNNDVANGGADVALRNQVSQGGELRGNELPASGEQTPTGTEPSDSGAGASDDSSTAGVEAVEGETPQSTDAAAITGEGYKVEPKPYTNKQGKTLDTYLVTFDRDFSKEELSTLRAKAKALKGWYDRETRGWMLRGADDAKAFAKDIVGKSEDEVADEAPLSLADMEKPASDKPKKAPVNRVNVEGVMADLYTKGETKLSDHAEPVEPTQTKPKKRRWISDEDADEFNNLRDNLRNHFGKGDDIVQERMDAEVLRMGTRMTYLMMKGGLRSFADYCEAMIDELPDIFDDMRPHLKSLYAAAQNMEEVIELGWDEEMDDRKTVKAFDVYNFDKPGAKDIIATSQHIVDEQSSQQHTDQIIQTLKDQRNEQRKKEADETSADTEAIADKAEAVASKVESELEVATTEQDAERLSRDLDKEIEDVNKQLALLGYYEAENNSTTPKNNSHEKTDVQARPETAGRGGQQPRPNEPLGTSAEHEAERTDGGRMAQRGGVHTVSDTKRGTGVSDQHQSERGVTTPRNTRNNHAERGVDYAPKGEKARIDANIAAIELAKKLLATGATATPQEMAILRRYSGWGGLGSAFNEGNAWSPNPINKRLREILTPEEYEAAVMSRNSAYYTPAPVIDAMWDIAKALGFKGGNIVEGSAGIGNIIGLMPTDISERSNIHAVEIDNTTGGILSLLYPDAQVEVQGFEKTRIANGSVDLAITNVPFVTGLHVMDESGDSDLSKKFRDIHDFCIAKNVRKLRDGGIGIFITSSGTLDKSQKLRNWLIGDKEGNADVVGVFRMNNQTFGGTAATSDIIVIRKRVNGRKSANAIDVSTVTPARTVTFTDVRGKTKDLPLYVNRYFIEHPEHMGGEMFFGFEQGDTYRPTSIGLFPTRTADQPARLAAWVQHLAEMDWSKEQGKAAEQTSQINEALGEGVKEGSMVTDSEGNLCVARMGRAVPLTFNKNKIKGRTKEQCFADYTDLKNALADVLKYQTEHNDDAGLQPLLDRLNSAYDTFVARYGNLNKNNNLAWLRNDVDFSSIVALETYSEKGSKDGTKIKTYGKTDIFSRRVVEKESEPAPKNVKDGIIASLYKYGRIDPEYLASQLGKSQADVKQEIIESGLGFENPTTGQMEVSYEYLSGNVREKLRQAREANEAANGAYDANIKALEAVVPMNIPAHLIEFTLGSSWVDPKLYERFVKERTDLNVRLTNAGGTWHMSEPYWTDEPKNKEMGIRSESLGILIPGHKLIEAAITNKTITVSKTTKNSDGTTTTETDAAATTACATKVDEIRQDFKDWAREQMQNDPELSMRMEEVYNEKFNNSVPKSIPDEFVPEHFGGAATMVGGRPFRLRPHQAKAVIRATTQPVLLAHEVGTGKTYTLITTAMEMRRLGTARKPMIVVQNATVGQFVASAKALYPNAKVLTLEDADRNAEGRKAFYAKIKFNDWDMIVVPQSVFERIPDSVERQTQFIQDKIEEKLLVLDQMKDAAPDGRSMIVRAAEREIEKLKDEISQLANGGATDKKKEKDAKKAAVTRQNAEVKAREMLDRATDDVEDFDSMGIDAILVDEAHEYKHLGFATAMQRGVKGVDPSFSKKSQGVFLKTQSVLEKTGGKNVVFATGTPISNTAAEIWTFMRYLMPADVMKDYGIYYFDDFVRNFGNLQQMLEFSTSGKYKENNRFAGYVNLPELVRIWSTVADTVLTREAGGVSDKIPQMEGGKAQDIFLPQTRALRSIMKFVKEQLDAYDNMSGKEKKENSHIPPVMYGIAKAAAVDARLVQSDAEDDPNSKTNEAVRQTLRTLEEAKDYNGTVAIFADNYQNKVSGFNLYEDIRKKLISAGVPEEQIVVMKSGMTVNKKLEIFSRVNAGEVRVIMGSTFKLGTGVNIQERLHTLIHLDAPNRPMDYTQRNGRILRQGNLHNEWGIPVRVLRFGVEDSLDVTAYQRLKTKGAIADSIMNGKQLMENSMENRALEEDQDLFGDITAQLSGSEYAMLKNQIEKEVRKLTAQRKSWEADQTYIHNRKRQIAGQNKEAEKRIAENKSYLEKVEAATVGDITVGKLSFPSVDAMEDFFTEQNKRKAELQEQVRKSGYSSRPATSDITISVGGFDFHIHTEINREIKQGQQGDLFYSAPAKMTYSCPELGIEAMPVKGNVIKNAVTEILNDVVSGEDFRGRIEAAERSIERNNAELQSISARDGVPFKFTEELAKAEEKLSEYEDLMKAEMEAKEAKYAELDKEVEAASNIELTEEDSEDAASEPIASYSEENANFASRYETQDGKTINYTSENAEGYGGLFDFDFSGENAGGNEVGMRSGANDLQRQGDTGLNRHNSRLDKEAGEFSLIERVFRESGSFNFTSGEKIESADDVAFIFSALEDAAKEHSFVVLVKDGKPTVVELGMGTFTATMVDIPTASLAYNRIQPDQVYFVHNHPSGNLMCSPQDVQMLRKIADISKVPVHGVIINLKTGKYGTFDTDNTSGVGQKRVPENESPLAVHTLDKQIFAPNYDPMEQPLVRGSEDVAKFLNSQRMGDRAKMSFIILSRAGRIVGNIHTPFTKLPTKSDEIARYISERVIQFGGESAILYGDFTHEGSKMVAYRNLKDNLNKVGGTTLLDVVNVEGNNTRSANDDGLLYELGSEYGASTEAKSSHAERMSKKFNTPIRIVTDTKELTNDNAERQARMRKSKGFYAPATGEVVIVIPNNANVEDVAETVFHEVVAHKGLREMIGEENYDAFCDEVYDHLKDDLKEQVDEETTRRFMNEPGKGYAHARRVAVDELLGRMAEKGFEDFTKAERGIWAKLKAKVLEAINKFLGALKLPKWVRLGDNELRYMLWRSHEKLRSRGSTPNEPSGMDYVDMARDAVKREELGLDRIESVWEREGYANIEVANKRFNEELTRYQNGEMKPHEILHLGYPRGAMRNFLPNLPIVMRQRVIRKGSEKKHDVDVSAIMNMPNHLASPIFIFQRSEDTIGVLTDMKDRTGKNVCVAIELKRQMQNGDAYLEVNDVRSFHGRDFKNIVEPIVNNHTLRWVDKSKGLAYLSSASQPVQQEIDRQVLEDAAKVIKNFENPLTDDDLRFRTVSNGAARREYDERVRTRKKENPGDKRAEKRTNHAAQLHEAYMDGMRSLRVLQEAVSHETGSEIESHEDAYEYENQLSSRNKSGEEEYKREYMKPMFDAIAEICSGKEHKRKYGELIDYVLAKHGLERNAFMRAQAIANGVDSDKADATDYAGLTALTGEQDVADAEIAAAQMVRAYEAAVDTSSLWKTVNAATKAMLTTRYTSGLLSRDMYDTIRTQYKNYIPLKGWEETVAADVYEYTGGGYGLGSALMKAYGRSSVADDPFATIVTDAQRTIMEANRNIMKQRFLNLALNHQTDLLTVNKQWYVRQADGSWLPDNPVIPADADADLVDAIVKQHEADMLALESVGDATKRCAGLQLGLNTVQSEPAQHMVKVKRNGEEFCIYVNGDPRAARAINGMLNPDAGEKTKIAQLAQEVKNFMSRAFTTWNPEFIVGNLSRDLMFAGTAVTIKEDARYARKYAWNITNILAKASLPRLLSKWEKGILDDNVDIERYFKEFLRNGGETGFTQLNTVDKVKKEMQRFLREAQGGVEHLPKKAWRSFWNGVEFMNRAAEDTTRFGVYMTSRQSGRTISRSISDAKEITVNFNRKGSGAWGARQLNFLYVFFNACMQAMANAGRLVKNNPVKSSVAMASFLSAGFLVPMVSAIFASLFGDEEDDYWNLPEWVRRNNICIYVPFTKKWLTIPIAHELRPFYGIGEIAYSTMNGKETTEDAVLKGVESFSGIMPIDWTGNGGDNLVNFAPTIVQPLVQVERNVDYFGKPIYKKTPWNENDPEWSKAYKGTNGLLVDVSKMLSEAGATTDEFGVTSYPQHWYSGDINPAIVEHLLESYSGGVGKTVNGFGKTISMLWNEDARELRNVPVVRKFLQSSDERAVERRFSNEYFKLRTEYEDSQQYYRKLCENARQDSVLGAAGKISKWLESEQGQRHMMLRSYMLQINRIENAIKQSQNEEFSVQLRERADSLKKELVQKAAM